MADEPSDPHDPVPANDRGDSFAAFLETLRQRRLSGKAARRAIIDRLAQMTPKELSSLPPSIVGRLGPRGLAELARRSTALQGLVGGMMPTKPEAEAPQPAALETVQVNSLFQRLQQRQPLPWQALKNFAIAIAIGAIMLGIAPIAWRLLRSETASDGAALCTQLDWGTGDCRYVTSSPTLTIDKAAQMLGLDPKGLAEVNPDLPPHQVLDPGTALQIPHRRFLNLR